MEPEKIIERAIKLLQPIKYESFDIGYFAMKNDCDMGGQDFCINCIDEAVELEKKSYEVKRASIISKFKQIEEKGYFKQGRKKNQVKGKYTPRQIADGKRIELEEYPEETVFSYEGHDPDFGGGLQEPCSCDSCGEYFTCNFQPNEEEAQHLLTIFSKQKIADRDKWECDIALRNYQHTKDNVKSVLYKVAECIIVRLSK